VLYLHRERGILGCVCVNGVREDIAEGQQPTGRQYLANYGLRDGHHSAVLKIGLLNGRLEHVVLDSYPETFIRGVMPLPELPDGGYSQTLDVTK
jgi:hypothetical protein